MRRFAAPLALAAVALVPAAARADGCPPSTCGAASLSAIVPGSRLMILRPSGTGGPLVGYDVLSGKRRFTLPGGVLSADGKRFFTARIDGRNTSLARYDARTGARRAVWSVHGRFGLTAVSASGRWLVLARPTGQPGQLRVEIAGGMGGSVTRTAALPSAEQPEAISPDGRRLFLVRALDPNDPLRYRLEVYDFATRALRANPPRNEANEKMTGIAHNAVASRDGHWLLTLYVNPQKRYAFVHALDLRSGVAHCIDLEGAPDTTGSYALVLSPDERTLYVAAPLTGAVHVVDLRQVRVARTIRFPRAAANSSNGIGPNAAASPLGGAIAFTLGRDVWTLRKGVVARPRELAGPVEGIAFTSGGRLTALVGGRLVRP